MTSYVVAAISLGITAAVESGGQTECGTGTARLRRMERKGSTGLDLKKFILKDGPVVPVVNTDPIAFASGMKIKLSFDETGVYTVINNVCE